MDFATLATTATALLAPHLAKMGEAVIQKAGEKLPEQVDKLWEAITSRFADKPAASGAAAELATQSEDPDNREAFILQLKKALKEDPEFAELIDSLVSKAQQTAGISNTGSGAVATGGSIGVGTINVGRDVSGNFVIGTGNTVTQETRKNPGKSDS